MYFRQKTALLAALAGVLLSFNAAKAEEVPASPAAVQLAAAPVHAVTINVMVNNGDTVAAKQVVLEIQPAYGNDNTEAKASLTGPGKVQLPEGSYRIVATLEQMHIEDRMQVGGPTTHTVALQAGFATLRWIEQIGGKAMKNDVQWNILTYKKINGERQLIAALSGAQPRLTLPEGWYIAEATYKGRTKRLAIEVANGRQYDYTLCASC